jgi:hypothetical protein
MPPLDPAIPPLAAAQTIETIWLVKLEVSSTVLATNYREGYTDGGDVYAYYEGLAVSAIRWAPGGEKSVCEVTFADADASMTWLPLDSANVKQPVTIKRAWWNGSAFVLEPYFAGLTGRGRFDALSVAIECGQKLGRRGKGTNVSYAGLMSDHAPLAPGTKIEVGG